STGSTKFIAATNSLVAFYPLRSLPLNCFLANSRLREKHFWCTALIWPLVCKYLFRMRSPVTVIFTFPGKRILLPLALDKGRLHTECHEANNCHWCPPRRMGFG